MMRLIFNPLIRLYRALQRKAEADALNQQIHEAFEREQQECEANYTSSIGLVDKHLTAIGFRAPIKWLTGYLRGWRSCDAIDDYLLCEYCSDETSGEKELEEALRRLCEGLDALALDVSSRCHLVKAREHTLKAFLLELEDIEVEGNEHVVELARAREEAHSELQYYQQNFDELTEKLVRIVLTLSRVLKRDLPRLSQAHRAKLEQYVEQYEEIYKSFLPKEETKGDEGTAWEQFPIVELLDIAEAYFPGMRRLCKVSLEAKTKN